jgi:two-component system, OmpR family, response regulator
MTNPATNPTRVLMIEDDRDISNLTAKFLRGNGLHVSVAPDGRAAGVAFSQSRFDVVLIDLMLPGEDGLSIARRLRATQSVAIIMLTALGEETDRIVGLEMGADDYLVKPFSPRELLARIRAVLRRSAKRGAPDAVESATYMFNGWRLEPGLRELTDPGGVKVALTGAEFELLSVFCKHPRRVLNRDQLLDLTQGRAATPFDRSIDTLVSRIRRKIERDAKDPDLLKTIRLGGYMFTPEVEVL